MLYLQDVIFQAKAITLTHMIHNFNTKLILTEQIRHINTDKEKNKEKLKERENFWILTVEALTLKGLNQEFN